MQRKPMRYEEKKDKQTNKNRKPRAIQAKKGMHIGKKDETKPHLRGRGNAGQKANATQANAE